MTLKEHTIFKSHLFLTLEEENAWKEDIAMWMNDCTCKDDGSEYTKDDDEVQERFNEDVWDMYDCEKANLDKELPNKVIAIADIGRWDGRHHGGLILKSNLNAVLYIGDCDDINVYWDRYNVQSIMAHHDGRHYVTYRMVKEGVDPDWLLDKHVYGEGLTSQEITRYTKSLVPFVQEVYGIKR